MKVSIQRRFRTQTSKRRLGALAVSILVGSMLATPAGAHPAGAGVSDGMSPDASCPSGQCFADVPSTNPFYEFTNRIYLQGLVSGYACGGAGEPCDADSRPYYRPGSQVTRQQMAKFIDNARRLPEIHIDSSVGSPPVWVRNASSGAIYGESNTGVAISGYTNSLDGTGVQGNGHLGVVGISVPPSLEATNLEGITGGPPHPSGVAGFSNSEAHGVGVYGFGNEWGVYGVTNADGTSGGTAAVFGQATGVNGVGLYGQADTGGAGASPVGVVGQSADGIGVYGLASNTGPGVLGYNLVSGDGVMGIASSVGASGIVGQNFTAGGFAGSFVGDVQVMGNLSKGGGSFKIDHPLDPSNKYLYHSFVESPDMMNIYNGNVTTDADGEAVITMPNWFDALNRDFRYQLTPIGQFAQVIVWQEMEGNTFSIKSDKPNVKVSWQVTGIRQDAYANAHRIPVEQDKAPQDQGKYLYPTEQGQPESTQLGVEPIQLPQQTQGQPAR